MRSCCCRCIRSIPRRQPAAVSTNGTGASSPMDGARACMWCVSFIKTPRTCMPWSRPSTHPCAILKTRRTSTWCSARTACLWPSSSRATLISGRSKTRSTWCGSAAAGRGGGTSATRVKSARRNGCARRLHETVRILRSGRIAARAGGAHLFVSDHVETLHEIDIEHREQARTLGIADFRMMPGLNDSPAFIGACRAWCGASSR